jgi:hypothetical protein
MVMSIMARPYSCFVRSAARLKLVSRRRAVTVVSDCLLGFGAS